MMYFKHNNDVILIPKKKKPLILGSNKKLKPITQKKNKKFITYIYTMFSLSIIFFFV